MAAGDMIAAIFELLLSHLKIVDKS